MRRQKPPATAIRTAFRNHLRTWPGRTPYCWSLLRSATRTRPVAVAAAENPESLRKTAPDMSPVTQDS